MASTIYTYRHQRQDSHRGHQGRQQPLDGERVFAEIIHQHDGRDGEQVEQVHADGQAHEVGNEDEPAVRARLVGSPFPPQYQPEHDGGEKRRVGVHFAFDRREPERVRKRVGQRAHHARAQHGDDVARRVVVLTLQQHFARQVRDGPEKEKDGQRTEDGRHGVDARRHMRGVGGKQREELPREHEERCSGRVPHVELVGGGDELAAVPEAGGRLDGHQVGDGRDGKRHPAENGVQ